VAAGAGPFAVKPGAPPAIAAAEAAVVTITGNWQQPPNQVNVNGNIISVNLNVTPGASQTLITVRVRQGVGTGGTLVGIAHPETTVAAQQADIAFDELDLSAFAQAGVQQSYTVTIQANAAGPGTINQAICYLGTTTPVI